MSLVGEHGGVKTYQTLPKDADGFTGSGFLGDGVVDGSPGILHIRTDILDALRKANGAVPVSYTHLDVYKRQDNVMTA